MLIASVVPTNCIHRLSDPGKPNSHGRIEIRDYYQSDQLDWFADLGKWEGLQSVGVVQSSPEVDGVKTVERRYYLNSLPLNGELFDRAVRSHWGVENKSHWVMDVCFHEDQSRARAGYAAENLATLVERHIKVRADANPYDPAYTEYFEKR